jgi:hypothetical protein
MTSFPPKKEARKIKCRSHGFITSESGRVWPCCYVCTTNTKYSPYLKKLDEEDPNWNNLNYRSLIEIINHEAYQKHFNKEHFEIHDKVDIICYTDCGHKIENEDNTAEILKKRI